LCEAQAYGFRSHRVSLVAQDEQISQARQQVRIKRVDELKLALKKKDLALAALRAAVLRSSLSPGANLPTTRARAEPHRRFSGPILTGEDKTKTLDQFRKDCTTFLDQHPVPPGVLFEHVDTHGISSLLITPHARAGYARTRPTDTCALFKPHCVD
jgi:hypothetical protein